MVASHEVLEMLADPSLNRMVAGDSPMPGQGRVEFLVEVCDPCQSRDHAYPVNELLVSDFVTPQYFDPATNPGVRYSFNRSVSRPHEVLADGYLSWRTPDGHLWQARLEDGQLVFNDEGLIPLTAGAALRSFVDQRTHPTRSLRQERGESTDVVLARARDRRASRVRAFHEFVASLGSLPRS
jgi:hypothetical protein